jgi:hypothetical protein
MNLNQLGSLLKRSLFMRPIFASLLIISVFAGCTSVSIDQKQAFIRHNPEIAKNADELFEVPIDQWVELEVYDGLGKLGSHALGLRKTSLQIADPDQREKAQHFYSVVLERCEGELISELVGLHEVRSRMGSQDRIFCCYNKNDFKHFYWRFFIVRDGRIREEVFSLESTWGIGNEALWADLLSKLPKK